MHPLVQLRVGIGVNLSSPRDPFQVGALDPLAAEVTGRQVHDRATEVGAERVGFPEVPQSTHEPRECFLHEVLG